MKRTLSIRFALALAALLAAFAFCFGCAEDDVSDDDEPADLEAPSAVRDFAAEALPDSVAFTWENPDTKDEDIHQEEIAKRNRDYEGCLIVRQAGSRPSALPIRNDKYAVGDALGDATVVFKGDGEAFTDTDVEVGIVYYYAAYPFDEVPNYGDPMIVDVTPGSHVRARFSHTADLLPGGRVLVVGGVCYGGPTDTAEVFDPETGGFTELDALMRTPRFGHETVAIDGGIYISGGYEEGFSDSLRSATVYRPETRLFDVVDGAMTEPRALHTTTALPDGTVLVTGGQNGEEVSDTAEIYDPATDAHAALESAMAVERASHTATLVEIEGESLVLIAGGYDGLEAVDAVELYDPQAQTFTAIEADSALAVPRLAHTATPLGDAPTDPVLFCGGFSGDPVTGEPTDTCEVFDPATGAFEDGPPLLRARTGHAATLLNDGRVLIVGGIDGDLNVLDSAEIVDVDGGQSVAAGSLVRARTVPQATTLTDGSVLVTGGNASGNVFDPRPVSTAELFDPDSQSFSIVAAP